ncbi:hypothetical protein COUCH_33005 [Couchioplanes caeruleus]|uniref:hypothetical protein n=1 Tax=Couchioplanes caeruleus TaxID=56438 RepID=UPI0020C04B85|nr:hypothetical protein [Couchioplanes caeruleus]UQU63759.1 hypothetical protein COUCH_33005 [Couchioplanes caeruleus]
MRVLRTILGMLLLTAGLPALLAGGAFWAAMQHRDAGGAFSGTMQRVATSGYAVVVDDVDELLRKDAPFARFGDTRLRITATSGDAPAFVGLAPRDRADAYLADIPRISVSAIDLGTGALPVTSKLVPGTRAPEQIPNRERFWLAAGVGAVDWNPTMLRDTRYSLIIMNPAAQPGVRLESTAAIRPGWLNQATWALLIGGTLLVMLGMIILGWPARRREVVYVVEPSQVPDLMQAIGAPLPLSRVGGGRHSATHRPRTLADCQPRSRPPALTWPPASKTTNPPERGAAIPMPAAAPASAPSPAAAPSSTPSPAAVPAPSPVAASLATASAPASGSPAPVPQDAAAPAPGAPLGLITPRNTPAPDASPSEPQVARTPARRRPTGPQPTDPPIFQASAVGAWVAETAAARARETEARAAAALNASRKGGGEQTSPAAKSRTSATPAAGATSAGATPAAGATAAAGATPAAAAASAAGASSSARPADSSSARPAESVPDGYDVVVVGLSVPEGADKAHLEAPAFVPPPSAPAAAATDKLTAAPVANKSAVDKPAVTKPAAATAEPKDPAKSVPDPVPSKQGADIPRKPAASEGKEATVPAATAGQSASPETSAASSSALSAPTPLAPSATKPVRPAKAAPRNALFGGPPTNAWAATGLTRADSGRVGTSADAPKPPAAPTTPATQPSTSPAAQTSTPATAQASTPAAAKPSAPSAPASAAAKPSAPSAQAVGAAEPSAPAPAAAKPPAPSIPPTAKPSSPSTAPTAKPSVPQASPAVKPSTESVAAPKPSQFDAAGAPVKAVRPPEVAPAAKPAPGDGGTAVLPAKGGTAPTPAKPVPPAPVPPAPAVPAPSSPSAPSGPAPARPSVPAPSRPTEPAREPVPAGSAKGETARHASPAQAQGPGEKVADGSEARIAGQRTEQRSPGAQPATVAPERVEQSKTAPSQKVAEQPKKQPEQPTAADQHKAVAQQSAVAQPQTAEQPKTAEQPELGGQGKAAEQPKEAAQGQTAEGSKAVDQPKAAAAPKKGLLGAYKDEVAELLSGGKAKRRRNVTASGLPAPDPEMQEPPIKLTRPPRRSRGTGKD